MTHIDVDTIKDHQGNLTATIHGNTVERLSYDPWGHRRNPVGFGYATVAEPVETTFGRGYTLHEHYDDFGLINMNGRCYDPVTSHFLSVDAYVQSPENAQGFNRYSYCLNNPLRYTDPSGWEACGLSHNNPFHDNWSRSFVEPVYEPRDLGIEQLTDYDAIWMKGEELHGGGNRGNGGEAGNVLPYVFGIGNPNSLKVKGKGACLFASLGEICIRLNKQDFDPTFWKEKEQAYYEMKNSCEQTDEKNHGYESANLVEFILWVGKTENIEFDIQQIPLKNIPDASIERAQVLVISSIYDSEMIRINNGSTGHAAVVNTFLIKEDGSVRMTFGDPSPVAIMPVVYRSNNSYGDRPEGFVAWGFYKINISRP